MSFETRDGRKSDPNIDDILSKATRELKRQCDGARANPAATRTRVMMSLRQQERRRVASIYVLLPAAAVLVASTAWAAANGHLPTVVRTIGERLGLMEAPSASMPFAPTPPPPRANAKAPAQEAAPRTEPTPPEAFTSPVMESVPKPDEVPAPPAAPRAEPKVAARPTAPPGKARPVPSATTFAPDEAGDKLYEAAHRAHFESRDWTAALAAWDRYLAASPNGRFAPEARYNRAIVLLRLDRRDEAVRELTPFADGKYGTYRQSESRGLIEAIQK